MKRFGLLLIALTWGPWLPAQTTSVDSVLIDSVVWYYKPEEVFKRIGEYFDGEERKGRKIIVRTQSAPRAGLYFIVRIDEFADELPNGCSVAVDMIRADRKEPVTEIFPLPMERLSHREIWLGFTGEDTPPNEEAPVAWRVRFLDPSGETVSTKQSFLWSKPAAE